MAAPFVLVTSTPGDTDIVSQFPTLDRADKVIIQTWINTDHNVDGTHTQASFVQVGTLLSDGTTTTVAPTPANNRTAIFRDTDGALKTKRGEDSTVEFLGGVPPGFVGFTASSTIPNGWLLADSSPVSRSTFARLFTAIGTLYGAGDGSTTFNLPDLRGRVLGARDTSAGRITVAGGNFDGTVLGSSGGTQSKTIVAANVPQLTFTGTATGTMTSTQSDYLTFFSNLAGGGGGAALAQTNGFRAVTMPSITPAGTVNTGSVNTPLPVLPPIIMLNGIIRY